MYRILHLLTGYIKVKISGTESLKEINALYSQEFKFWGLDIGEDCYYISCSVFAADKLVEKLKAMGANFAVVKRGGLPFAVFPYRGRPGMVVGMLIAMAIVYGSTRILWDVRVDCNGDYDRAEVTHALKGLGVYSGALLKEVNIYEAELKFLMENPRYSDIAVNIQGTVAAVKLRVRTEAPRQEDKAPGAYDVVAKEAGIIRSVSAVKGAPVVKRGDTVAAGDVLISGVMQGAYGEYYLHHASGSVKATVYREFSVIIPLESTQKVYTGETEKKVSYTVLGKRVDMFLDELSNFEYADADTHTKKLTLFGAALPIVKEALVYRKYYIATVYLTQQQAEDRAKAAFSAFIERELDGDVVNTTANCVYDEELDAVVLNGTVELVAEIGVETPMSVIPEPTTQIP